MTIDDDWSMMGDPTEHEIRGWLMGQRIVGVEEVCDRVGGDELRLTFAGGGTCIIRAKEKRIRLGWDGLHFTERFRLQLGAAAEREIPKRRRWRPWRRS